MELTGLPQRLLNLMVPIFDHSVLLKALVYGLLEVDLEPVEVSYVVLTV